MTRRAFLQTALASPLLLAGCGGYPAEINPPVFYADSLWEAAETARLHARDLAGGRGKHDHILPTGSMRPVIQDYDWIVWDEGRPFESLKAGEIILYWPQWPTDQPMRVLHRLIEKDSYGWILRGDNVRTNIDRKTGRNLHSEASYRVTKDNYIGALVAVYRLRAKKS